MAKLSSFTINSAAVEQGDWVSPGEEYDGLMIKTRGFTFAYSDALASKMRRAAVGFGGNQDKVPSAIKHMHIVECLIAHCLQDVKNLTDDDGNTVNFPVFCDALRNPDHKELLDAAIRAAAIVGQMSKQSADDAAGN